MRHCEDCSARRYGRPQSSTRARSTILRSDAGQGRPRAPSHAPVRPDVSDADTPTHPARPCRRDDLSPVSVLIPIDLSGRLARKWRGSRLPAILRLGLDTARDLGTQWSYSPRGSALDLRSRRLLRSTFLLNFIVDANPLCVRCGHGPRLLRARLRDSPPARPFQPLG